MSEHMSIHRDEQRAKWHQSDTTVTDTKPDDLISRKHVNIRSAFLAERPNLTGR
jgi:hypothetical protein